MKKTVLVAALGLGALFLAYRPGATSAQSGASNDGLLQFRIALGLTDLEEKDWTGRLTATGGQIVSLKGWRFSGEDEASNSGIFRFRTKIGNFENQLNSEHPYGQTDWNDPKLRRLIPQGLIVRVRGTASTKLKLETRFASLEFTAADASYTEPATRLNGNAMIERLPMEEKLSEPVMGDDHPVIAVGPKGERWTAWIGYQEGGDWVVVSDGNRTTRVTEKGDHQGPAIAATPNGWVTVAWAQRDGAEFHIYTTIRALERWSTARRVTVPGSSNINPVLATDDKGRIILAWQTLREGRSSIRMKVYDGRNWGEELPVSQDEGNAWSPSVAFGGGKLWIAWDSYLTGAYQIYARQFGEDKIHRITAGANFSVRPSIAVNPDGVPAIAWEESDALWGKDFAFLTDRRGTTIYKNRRIRLAVLDNGEWKEHPASIAETMPPAQRRFLQQPRIAFDPFGRLHMAFRARTSATTARIDQWASGGHWESFLTSLDGEKWSRALPLPASDGRNSMRTSLAVTRDTIFLAWATDNRNWPQGGQYGDLDVYSTRIPTTSAISVFRNGMPLTAANDAPMSTNGTSTHANENEDTARIRAHRVSIGGHTYRILRGDLHRHTELSTDGSGDGALEDLYRYALDAAQMDYAHVADHQMGNDQEYNWWFTQKSNDLYFMPNRFVPLYGYERSVPYPNGHRNVIWAERGKQVLRIQPGEMKGEVNTGSVLYPYLKGTGGIATSHTSATEQGTDWRDNDPSVEPFVEIYQGFESNYEHEGAPRSWKPGEKTVHQGARKLGYVWNAWAKGYKLGVQASSDHVSTHTSYACILAEEFSRKGLLDAMRKRHTYAATDSIILDFRANDVALMGDIITSAGAPKLQVKVIGTAPIKQIDLIKNNTYIHKISPDQKEAGFEYVDAAAGSGESYYYVRVEQTDGQLAWSSPIWITLK